MLATPLLQPENDPPKGGEVLLEKSVEPCLSNDSTLNLDSSDAVSKASNDEYVHLQRRTSLVTIVLSTFVGLITAFFFDIHTTISLLIGAISGLLYLRLLARSIGKLGVSAKTVGKIQLIVPVLLVLLVSKLPQLELLPSLLGFLLYKPSLIIQVMLDS